MLSCISPMFPRVFTLLSTRFRPPTSCASVCISPKPFCTLSSCSVTRRKDWPMRSFSVFCNFSSTVTRISSRRFSVLATSRRCCSSRLANFSRWRLLKEAMPRSKASLNSFMERVSSSRLSRATIRPSSRFSRKSSRKFFSMRSKERCISSSKRFSSFCVSDLSSFGRNKICKTMIIRSPQIINQFMSFYFAAKIEKQFLGQVIKKS